MPRDLEGLTLDREVMHLRDSLSPRYAELVYYGYWYSPEMELLRATIDESQKHVTGTARLKLYKGNCDVVGRKSQVSLYDPEFATFEAEQVYHQGDATGFIRLNALRLRIRALTQGRPGYISDPVIDTSKRQIIYAHCVAPNRVFGPAGPANPYHIRNHSEDRKGACVRSLMPLNQMTTTLEFDAARRQVIFHQAKTVANIDEDMACRTKLAAEVKKVVKLPIIAVGRVDAKLGEQALRQKKADFIAMCRPLIRQPNLPHLWRSGDGPDKAECISCNACIPLASAGQGCKVKNP
jgi:hypothetical protein